MKYIPIGRALGTHGVKGEVKFRYYNEAKEGFLKYASLFFKKDNLYTELELARKRLHKGLFLVKFKGMETPESVAPLLNCELFIRVEDLPLVEENEYYVYQLIGLRVVDRKQEEIGEVKELVHTEANDLLVVDTGREEVFIPLTEEFICNIDMAGLSITVDEGALGQ